MLVMISLEITRVSAMKSLDNRRAVSIPPPAALERYGPSALMRYFITAGGWSYEGFAGEVSQRHKTRTMNTDTVVGWTNHDVLPGAYRPALLKVIDDCVDPSHVDAWRTAFYTVWSDHAARPKKRAANFNSSVTILNGCRAR